MIRTGYRTFCPALALGQLHTPVRASIKKRVGPPVGSDKYQILAKQHYRFGFVSKLSGKESRIPIVTKPQFCCSITSPRFFFQLFLRVWRVLEVRGSAILRLTECLVHFPSPPYCRRLVLFIPLITTFSTRIPQLNRK